jgi:hypothetical protein
MNLCCNTLCSDDYKFKLQSFDLVLAGHIDGVYQNKVVFFHNQKNPLTNNVIYDYIEDIGGSTLYNNKR